MGGLGLHLPNFMTEFPVVLYLKWAELFLSYMYLLIFASAYKFFRCL